MLRKGVHYTYCTLCHVDFNISHGGRDDCHRYVNSKRHTEEAELEVIKAEVYFTNFWLSILLLLLHAFKCMIPKSSVANSYQCGRMKTTAIVLQQCKSIQEDIVNNISSQPFSIATDGSNDSKKLYPVVVRYFDNTDRIVTEALLSVPTCDGASTGENIFTLLDDDLKRET